MRDVLCNRTFLFFSTDRRKPLESSEFFSCVFSSQTAEEFKQKKTKKKKTSSAFRMQKRNLEVPPHT